MDEIPAHLTQDADRVFLNYPHEALVTHGESVRYLIISMGGMATKSLVENVLMDRFGISRGVAHTVTNMIETLDSSHKYYKMNPVRWISETVPEPRVELWPYLDDFQPKVIIKGFHRSGFVFSIRRSFEKVLLTYKVGTLDQDVARLLAQNYAFLLPPNKAVTADVFAKLLREHSSSYEVQRLALALENIR